MIKKTSFNFQKNNVAKKYILNTHQIRKKHTTPAQIRTQRDDAFWAKMYHCLPLSRQLHGRRNCIRLGNAFCMPSASLSP